MPKNTFNVFLESISKPDILLPNIVAAAVITVMNVTTAISIGALVFSGSLAPYLSTGIGLYLVSTIIGGLLIAMKEEDAKELDEALSCSVEAPKEEKKPAAKKATSKKEEAPKEEKKVEEKAEEKKPAAKKTTKKEEKADE